MPCTNCGGDHHDRSHCTMPSPGNLDLFGDDIDELDDSPVIRILVPAKGQAIPSSAMNAPTSIFHLADRPVHIRTAKNEEPASACYAHLSVASGVTKVAGASYPSRWTNADHEREAERRQRQRPPRPSRAAKTKSAKLRDLIGDDDGA